MHLGLRFGSGVALTVLAVAEPGQPDTRLIAPTVLEHVWPVQMKRVAGSEKLCGRSSLLFVHETERQLSIYDGADRFLLLTMSRAADGSVDEEAYSKLLRLHMNVAVPPGMGPRVLDAIKLGSGDCQYHMEPYHSLTGDR